MATVPSPRRRAPFRLFGWRRTDVLPALQAAAASGRPVDIIKGGIIPSYAKPRGTAPAVSSPGQAAPHVRPVPAPTTIAEPAPDPDPFDISDPDEDTPPRPVHITPGTYTITYTRLGRRGRRGTPLPAPFTVTAHTTPDLTDAIAAHARPHATAEGRPLHVVIDTDPKIEGGQILAGDRVVGAFDFTFTPASDAPDASDTSDAKVPSLAPEATAPFLLYPYNLPDVHDLTAAQRDGEACIYCPGDITPTPGDSMRFVGRLRGVLVRAHRDCAEQHRITE
ncbi:hypothetical protein [Actinacidiphila acididurans]|uniref:Uncharacterized protein n=1 Tax=Actinacidiphila acididurans TaxID=2784346 RepID=A0ABS2U2X5_9ACTN|nr:hypothetical protein [Actinacidiphila acididurans]MBM9509934.1 hypothetical protein [Actinacidiphila acididurans]